jgi:hypothetical protein
VRPVVKLTIHRTCDARNATVPCQLCLKPVGAFVFVVRENRIVEVRSVGPEDVTTIAEYTEVRPDGSSLSRPEWNDRPLTVAPG